MPSPFSKSPQHQRQRVHILQISIPPTDTVEVAKPLSQAPVQLTGLDARDSLRIDAGISIHPVKASLSWSLVTSDESGRFIGVDLVLNHLKDGPPRRRVGFIVEGAPARCESPFLSFFVPPTESETGVRRGRQDPQTFTWRRDRDRHARTSSPTLEKNIAMGYVGNG